MQDMLVRLYDLPNDHSDDRIRGKVKIKRALAPELEIVASWVAQHFSGLWESECRVAFSHSPVGCFVAYIEGEIIGFACYNTTAKAFFGPTGVLENYRGWGIGRALLLESLYALKYEGYVYAIIGGVGPVGFYQKTVGAQVIENSDPGIYRDLLRN